MRRFFTSTGILIGSSALVAVVVSSGPLGAAPAGVSVAEVSRTREITLPAGTVLRLKLHNAVGSDFSRREDPVTATLAAPVVRNGRAVIAAGSTAQGYVSVAQRSGKVKGRARLGLRFNTLLAGRDRERYEIATRPWLAVARATKRKDALEIGAPAAGGAVIGALVGGKKGAGIGALAGGGAGTAVVLSTRGKEVRVGRGGIVNVRLASPLTVRVPL